MGELGIKKGVRPFQLPGTQFELQGGRALVSDAQRTVVLALNESAAAVWELCDGQTTIDEMVMAICELSSIRPDQAREDVETTIAQLERAGLLTFSPGVSRSASPWLGSHGGADLPDPT